MKRDVNIAACIVLFIFCPCVQTTRGESPWRRHVIDDSSRGADGVRLADVNNDNLLDIATGWESGDVVRAYLNPGPMRAARPWPAVTVGRVASPEDAVFVDVDADGANDVVSCCEGDTRTVFIHWAPKDASQYLEESAWSTAALPCTRNRQAWMFAAPMQIDGRHGIDLVVGSKGDNASIGWLEAPSDPRQMDQWAFHPLHAAGWIMSLQLHDMDCDGDQDVLASDRIGATRGVFWLENPGSRYAKTADRWSTHRIDAGDREVMFLARGFRRPTDILCAVKGRGIGWFQFDPRRKNHFSITELPAPASFGTGKGVASGDVNMDGVTDIVFSCERANGDLAGVGWFDVRTDRASNDWIVHDISGPRGIKFDRVELVDLDGDTDLDVITTEENEELGVIWYENPICKP